MNAKEIIRGVALGTAITAAGLSAGACEQQGETHQKQDNAPSLGEIVNNPNNRIPEATVILLSAGAVGAGAVVVFLRDNK